VFDTRGGEFEWVFKVGLTVRRDYYYFDSSVTKWKRANVGSASNDHLPLLLLLHIIVVVENKDLKIQERVQSNLLSVKLDLHTYINSNDSCWMNIRMPRDTCRRA
jgi:hypothetical protein